jgi:SAM-dependent MidA family methyltransferase
LDVGRFLVTGSNPALVEFVRAEIENNGPVSFARFMEQALYHPDHGYYSSGRARIGRGGDYFTNVSVGALFGRLLSTQFDEIWRKLGEPGDFVIVEQGTHAGEFAHDVLQTLETRFCRLFDQIRYRIVEPIPILQERQRHTLARFEGKVDWRDRVETLEPFSGVHFSNELLDAMPVHLVCSLSLDPSEKNGEWAEKVVDWRDGKFVFANQPIANSDLVEQLKRLPRLPAGYETEINLDALEWIDRISTKLIRGAALTIDYGYTREELFAKHPPTGSLQCRASHRVIASPFEEIGNCDITAHVDWTSVVERAAERDFRLAGFTDQHHFLTGIISAWPELAKGADPKGRRALQTLLHPEMLGRSFQVLALTKSVDSTLSLSGFKFARDSRRDLGL